MKPDHTPSSHTDTSPNAFKTLLQKIYFHRLPKYGNSIFYGLGFLALTSLVILIVTGTTMAFLGQNWWLHNSWGIYFRSVHLWAVQAFIAILVLHFTVGFFTKAYRPPRRMVWVLGATIFCLALIQTEFGYGLRGDFESQFRAVSGADFWNGSYFGWWMNPLSYNQALAIHIAIIPIAIVILFVLHYVLEHSFGISKPYRNPDKYPTVTANHKIMYTRGVVLVALIALAAYLYPSPYVPPLTIAGVTTKQPTMVAQNMLAEFTRTSDTATYLDSIDPYTFDTRQVYIITPYEKIITTQPAAQDAWSMYQGLTPGQKQLYVQEAKSALQHSSTAAVPQSANPVLSIIGTLMPAARNGLYASIVSHENPSANDTYTLRFLNDMDVFETKASTLDMSTDQLGMIKDETGSMLKLPPGSWWLAPLALLNSVFNLPANDAGDRIAAESLFVAMILFVFFPYIPYLNRLPDIFNLGPVIWDAGSREKGKRRQHHRHHISTHHR